MTTNVMWFVYQSQKYEKSLYKAKQKLSPQESWMKSIELSIESSSEAPKGIQQYLTKLTDFGNIPRNKNKFTNSLKNSFRLQSAAVIDDVWDWISKRHAKEIANEIPDPSNEITNSDSLKELPSTSFNAEPEAKLKGKKKDKKHKRDLDEGTSCPILVDFVLTVDEFVVDGSTNIVEDANIVEVDDAPPKKKKKHKKSKHVEESLIAPALD